MQLGLVLEVPSNCVSKTGRLRVLATYIVGSDALLAIDLALRCGRRVLDII